MSDVVIVVRTEDRTSGAAKSINTKLEDMKKQLVAIAAAAATFKKAFDFSREGAAFIQTGRSFDLLLQKVGAAPDLLKQLQDASGNTIGKMKLMSSTATLLAGAQGELATVLADSTPQLLEIAKAAGKLNPALGDTTFLYQSLAVGVKRASPLILDNLGLTIKIGEANEKYAASIGKTVKALTVEEQKLALLEETMRAGRVLIDQVGGSTDSMTDSWDRVTAKTEDATNAVKAWLAEGLMPYLEILEGGALNINDALDRQIENLTHSAKSYEEYALGIDKAARAAGKFNVRTLELDDSVELLTETQWKQIRADQWRLDNAEALVDDRRREIDWTGKARISLEDYTAAVEDDRLKMIDWGPVIEATSAELEAMEEAAHGAALADQLLNEQLERAASLTGDYFVEAVEAEEITDDWAEALFDAADAAGADATELGLLAGALGLYTDEQIEAAIKAAALQAKLDEVAAAFAAGELTADKAKQAVIEFRDEMDKVKSKTITITAKFRTIGWDPTVLIERPELQHGAWEIPRTQVALVHAGEMVIPAPQAEQIRQSAGGVQIGTLNFNSHTLASADTTIQNFNLAMAMLP